MHPKGENSMDVCCFGCKIPQQGHCTNGPGRQSSHLTGPPMQCSSAVHYLELASIA